MSPILVRPVREQLEHDRIIRLLQAKWRRRYDVAANVGDEKNASIKLGQMVLFPDLILTSPERGRRLHGVVEVETGESVNHLEAMAQWAHFAKARGAFYLFVPAGSVDIARRLCADLRITATEMWTYHTIGDQIRFTMVYRSPVDTEPARRAGGRPRPAASTRRKPPRAAAKQASRAKTRSATRKTARTQKRK